MKKNAGIVLAMILYAFLAVGIVFVIYIGGTYPSGVDTMCHIYKGDVLYHSIKMGNWYPLYDNFWYNGVQMMRYWAPLPVYFLAFCQWLAGGSDINGYLIFISLVFYMGALSWLFISIRKKRIFMGAFIGVLWFFMPNNLYALFVEGNLPRTLSMVLLPLFLYFVSGFLFENEWKDLLKAIPVFVLILLCHVGYAGMLALAMLVFLLVYRLVMHQKGKCMPVIISIGLSFAIIGIWLYASLKGGITSTDSSQVMKGFFQDALISLNPVRRLLRGNVDFYFGLAAFLIALFGAVCGQKKSMPGFITAIVIFVCTTTSMYAILAKLPGSQYLWMLRFISIALCMILYSFLCWKTLKRGFVIICCVLLVLDILPSYSLIYRGKGNYTARQNMEQSANATLIKEARNITKQRVALLDGSTLGAMAPYLLTDYDGQQTQGTFGAGWQSAATASNIVQLNEAVEQGFYTFLFDRCLELGDDTVLIKKSELQDEQKDIPEVTQSAQKLGYQLVDSNDSYLLYHLHTTGNFGTTCKYEGLGIGTSAELMAFGYPNIEPGDSTNLSDYSYQELLQYKVIYLDGFTYDDKDKAEKLVLKLSEAGVRIIINGDGIPSNEKTKVREFLGVDCQDIYFQNGYPILYTRSEEMDTSLFDAEYRNWKTVYFNGLDKVTGYLYDSGVKVDFAGNVENDNIVYIGLNLSYHYFLTKDEAVGKFLGDMMNDAMAELPDRKIVSLTVDQGTNQIVIVSPEDHVNTTLAYHDIFESEQKIQMKHHLTEVDHGVTVIHFRYPNLKQGLLLTIAGLIGTLLFAWWMYRKYAKDKADLQND